MDAMESEESQSGLKWKFGDLLAAVVKKFVQSFFYFVWDVGF